jgi:hypothetical protein
MKYTWITPLLLLSFVACGRAPLDLGPQTRTEPQAALSIERLKGLRVKELFVVVFPKNYTPLEWKTIFDDTRILSRNKRRLRALEGLSDDVSQDERAELIGKNAEILTTLGSKSLFMMSWSAADENCRIRDTLKITCRPSNPDNPLNGGLPKHVSPIEWVRPDPVRSEVKTPYVAIRLEQKDAEKGPLYGLDLRLKPESLGETELWFKGEALPVQGSLFSNPEGSPVSEYFPYGYAEMTLGE